MTGVLKRIKFFAVAVFIAVFVICMLPHRSEAVDVYYDKILYYGIEAHVLPSGSVEFTYTIDWKVLVEDVDEPFTWVKIGIPNENAEKFKALTDNIKSVRFMRDGGTYAKVKFRQTYRAGDVIHFSFSFIPPKNRWI